MSKMVRRITLPVNGKQVKAFRDTVAEMVFILYLTYLRDRLTVGTGLANGIRVNFRADRG